MPEVPPVKATEAWLERASFLAIAETQQEGVREISRQHARATYAQAASNATTHTATATIEDSLIRSLAVIDAAAENVVSFGQTGATIAEANAQGAFIVAEAANQVAASQRQSAAELAVIAASTAAQVRAIREDAATRAESRTTIAEINAESLTDEAEIRVSTITATTTARERGSLEEASLRATATSLISAQRVLEISTTATHQADASADIAFAQYDANVGVARIRSQQSATIDAIQLESTRLVAETRARDTRDSAGHQRREILASAVERDRERSSTSLANATNMEAVARVGRDSRIEVADLTSVGARRVADLNNEAERGDGDANLAIGRIRYGAEDDAARYQSDMAYLATTYESTSDRSAALAVANTRSGAETYSADTRYSSVVLAENRETARLIKMLGFAQDRFEEIWAALGEIGEPGQLNVPATAARPRPSRGGVYTWSQIQARQNMDRAEADAKAESEWLAFSRDSGFRGVGGWSPAVLAKRLSSKLNAARVSARKSAETLAGMHGQHGEAILKGAANHAAAVQAGNAEALASESNEIRRIVGLLNDVAQAVRSASR